MERREAADLSPAHRTSGQPLAPDRERAGADHRPARCAKRAQKDSDAGRREEREHDLCGLGDALAGQDRYVEAEAAYREAVAGFLASERPEHPEVAYCLHNLADTLTSQGRASEAEDAYRESIRRKERSLGARHYEVGASMNNLAALLFETGRRKEARECSRRALELVRDALPANHPVRLGCEALARSVRSA